MDVIVETASGKLRGAEARGAIGFKGIPYGATTAGRNRFRPPVAPEPWTGVRDALKYGNRSPQPAPGPSLLNTATDGPPLAPESEDCLYLNVWTPAVRDH